MRSRLRVDQTLRHEWQPKARPQLARTISGFAAACLSDSRRPSAADVASEDLSSDNPSNALAARRHQVRRAYKALRPRHGSEARIGRLLYDPLTTEE
jgi:hypothetical protein